MTTDDPNLYQCPRCFKVLEIGTDDLAGDEDVVRQRIAHDCVLRTGQAPCCDLHNPATCCDPDDCGPCCEQCPTCPTLHPELRHTYRQWVDDQDVGNTCCLQPRDAPVHTPRANDNEGPFSIGSDNWPGLSKLIEECGEVLQVAGKLVATGGRTDHWSGHQLDQDLADELGDLQAAIDFAMYANADRLDTARLCARRLAKLRLFLQWHGRPLVRTTPDPAEVMARTPMFVDADDDQLRQAVQDLRDAATHVIAGDRPAWQQSELRKAVLRLDALQDTVDARPAGASPVVYCPNACGRMVRREDGGWGCGRCGCVATFRSLSMDDLPS